MSLKCSKAGNIRMIMGPYSAPRPATYEILRVPTVHRGRQHMEDEGSVQRRGRQQKKHNASVQHTEDSNIQSIKGLYSAPRPATYGNIRVREGHRGWQHTKHYGSYSASTPRTYGRLRVRTVYRGRQYKIKDLYSAPGPVTYETLRIRKVHRDCEHTKN
jgi:hypothetical protein